MKEEIIYMQVKTIYNKWNDEKVLRYKIVHYYKAKIFIYITRLDNR